MITVGDRACFGVCADREAPPDADVLAEGMGDAIAELFERTRDAANRAAWRARRWPRPLVA